MVQLWPAAPDRVYRESHGHELGPIPMTPASSARGNTKSTHFRPTKWVDLTGDIIWEMVLDQRCPPLSLFQGMKSSISGPNRLCGGSRLFPGVGGDLSPKYGLFPSNIPTFFFVEASHSGQGQMWLPGFEPLACSCAPVQCPQSVSKRKSHP